MRWKDVDWNAQKICVVRTLVGGKGDAPEVDGFIVWSHLPVDLPARSSGSTGIAVYR